MKKLIIDCDPGHDDIIAILIALAHDTELKILGFTTVAGNQTVEKVTVNLLKVLDHLGLSIPVSVGSHKPLVKEAEPQPLAHGESGMDGPNLEEATSTPTGMTAVEFMKETLEKEDKVTLVALGPLTNIAMLLTRYPHLKNKIGEIVLMGGSVYSGNILVKAEFNIYHDPEAAKIVFNAKIPLTMAGLEVCNAGAMKLSDIERFHGKGKVSQLVYELLVYYSGYAVRHNMPSTPIFDMTAVIYLLYPELFVSRKLNVDIELDGVYTRGMTVCEEISENSLIHNPVNVLMDVRNDEFIRSFFDAIDLLDKKYI